MYSYVFSSCLEFVLLLLLCKKKISVPTEKLVFDLMLALVSSHSWVTAPKHLCMWSGGKLARLLLL